MGESVTSGYWWQYACRSVEPDLFFPISAKGRSQLDVARAKMVCGRCPVCSQCLDYARATGQPHGIWGGLTEIERQPGKYPGRVVEDHPGAGGASSQGDKLAGCADVDKVQGGELEVNNLSARWQDGDR